MFERPLISNPKALDFEPEVYILVQGYWSVFIQRHGICNKAMLDKKSTS